jgi:hypothetical protein
MPKAKKSAVASDAKRLKITLVKSPIGFNSDQGRVVTSHFQGFDARPGRDEIIDVKVLNADGPEGNAVDGKVVDQPSM